MGGHSGTRTSAASVAVISGSRTLRRCETSPAGRWLLTSEDDVTPHLGSEPCRSPRIGAAADRSPRAGRGRVLGRRRAVGDHCRRGRAPPALGAVGDGSGSGASPHRRRPTPVGDRGPAATVAVRRRRRAGTLLALDPRGQVTEHRELPGLTGKVSGLFSDGGRWLSTWDGRAVRVFDLQHRVERLELPHDPDRIT